MLKEFYISATHKPRTSKIHVKSIVFYYIYILRALLMFMLYIN